MPPTHLILQALHAIRDEGKQTNERLKQLDERLTSRIDNLTDHVDRLDAQLGETNERLESLRVFTVQKLTDLNTKMDEGFTKLAGAVEQNTAEVHELRDRFDHFLTGEGARLEKRVTRLEDRLDALDTKPH
jgi:predicted nuclease with TOPRIM domain